MKNSNSQQTLQSEQLHRNRRYTSKYWFMWFNLLIWIILEPCEFLLHIIPAYLFDVGIPTHETDGAPKGPVFKRQLGVKTHTRSRAGPAIRGAAETRSPGSSCRGLQVWCRGWRTESRIARDRQGKAGGPHPALTRTLLLPRPENCHWAWCSLLRLSLDSPTAGFKA